MNTSIQRSVEDQNAFLDRAERRRVSISSMCSSLSELSSCDPEDFEQNASWIEPSMPPPSALRPITNVPSGSNEANWSMAAPSMPAVKPLSTPSSTAVQPVDRPLKDEPPNPQNPTKKPRRRQKKKKKVPVDVEAAAVEIQHKHQKDRMQKFRKMKAGEKSKKTRMESARCMKVLNGVTPVPFEPAQFRPSLKVAHESRVYHLQELEALGVRTIPWDGRYANPPLGPAN